MLKIAFLFLTIANVDHENYWKDFFTNHEDQYSVYVHAKETVSPHSFFKKFEIKQKVPTTWACTMNAQLMLLKKALEDPDNEKFVFISESTIPLHHFDTVYETLMSTPNSFFFFHPNPYVNLHGDYCHAYNSLRNYKPIPIHKQFKNAQWVTLNRKHAQMLVEDKEYKKHIVNKAHDQEHYPSTVLLNSECFEEITPCDTTYCEWHKGPMYPYVFTDLANEDQVEMITNAIDYGYLFARKFPKECNLKPIDHLLPYKKNKHQIVTNNKPPVFDNITTAFAKLNIKQ